MTLSGQRPTDRCRWSHTLPIAPGSIRYWRYLLMLLVFSYVLFRCSCLCLTFIHLHYLPIAQGRCAHRTKTIELLNFYVLWSCGLVCHSRRGVDQLLPWLG